MARLMGVLDQVSNDWRKALGLRDHGSPTPVALGTARATQAPFTSALQRQTMGGQSLTRSLSPSRMSGMSGGLRNLTLPSIDRNTGSMRGMTNRGGGFGNLRTAGMNTNFNFAQSSRPRESWAAGMQRHERMQELQQQQQNGEGSYSGGRGLEGVEQWDPLIKQAAQEAGIPWQVVASIMGIESGGQLGLVSPAGAVGLMQVMPEYWQDLANQFGGDLHDPWTNIRTGAQILKILYDQYGSWDKAAAAYLGAIDANGNITDAADAFGTTGWTYVDLFNGNMQALGYGQATPAEVMTGGAPATEQAYNAVEFALSAQGIPYVWGGADLNGFDCSGLVLWAFAQSGIELPRTAEEQFYATQRIRWEDAQPGDLVFFQNTSGPGITHVGIYLGNGQMLHAPVEGDIVRVTSITDPFWQSHLAGFGRVM